VVRVEIAAGDTMMRSHMASRLVFVRISVGVAIALTMLFLPARAHAFVNAGVDVGLFKRSADPPNNLKPNLGYGLHGELDLLPLLKVGPYYLHYELSSDDSSLPRSADATFNTLGLRARIMLPLPVSFKPYLYVGAGYSWVNYKLSTGDLGGNFLEIPIGGGIAFQALPLLQLSLDAAYRPGTNFSGDAYNASVTKPTSGYSVTLGVSIDL
jgi:hypothetical protein